MHHQHAQSRRSPRDRGVTRAVLAALTLLMAALLPALPVQAAPQAVTLERVTGFTNPGALNMYVYRPADLPAGAPIVVALHGCTQNAQDYADNAGLTTFADRDKFLLVFPEQQAANNFNRCFNWFQPGDITRGQGEAASIRNMVSQAAGQFGADESRAYVTGLSAGGVMTSVLLAAYPDVFDAGAIVAGLPYGCATSVLQAFSCMNPGVDRTPAQWAQQVRAANPSWTGPWPRVAIWHGTADATVAPRGADELRDQWTAVHGLGQTPTATSTLPPNNTAREDYATTGGAVAVQVNKVPGMGHGNPVRPGSGEQDCGRTGTYYLNTICSSYHITEFFGLG